MDGNRFRRLLTLALCSGIILAACSTSQDGAEGGVVGFERTTTVSTTRIQIGAADKDANQPASSNDEFLTASIPEPEPSVGSVREGSYGTETSASTLVDNLATSTTDLTSDTAVQVDQNDLVACAKVEVGYLFLLEGELVKAVPYLEQGADHSTNSSNADYVSAALTLAESIGTGSVTTNADAFLAVCAADGFERLA